jgi:hypothetical protein
VYRGRAAVRSTLAATDAAVVLAAVDRSDQGVR